MKMCQCCVSSFGSRETIDAASRRESQRSSVTSQRRLSEDIGSTAGLSLPGATATLYGEVSRAGAHVASAGVRRRSGSREKSLTPDKVRTAKHE